jgi:hypothetical protein
LNPNPIGFSSILIGCLTLIYKSGLIRGVTFVPFIILFQSLGMLHICITLFKILFFMQLTFGKSHYKSIVEQLLVHGRWPSLGTPASPTTKTGRHDIAAILLKVALKHNKSISFCGTSWNNGDI